MENNSTLLRELIKEVVNNHFNGDNTLVDALVIASLEAPE